MFTTLDPSDPESLSTLQAIEAVLIQRAQGKNITALPVFAGQNLSGAQLLSEYADHLRELARTLKVNGDGIPCDPHCADDTCPPCDGWDLSRYKQHLAALKIASAVDINFLRKIYDQYVARVPMEQGRNPKFQPPALPPSLPALMGPGRLQELFEFHQYLKTLPSFFSDEFGCDPPCIDKTCPPCEDWDANQYAKYLESLQKKVNRA